ncbi:MAG: hypothetical protein AAF809_08370 [Bacteroidota bacterium]
MLSVEIAQDEPAPVHEHERRALTVPQRLRCGRVFGHIEANVDLSIATRARNRPVVDGEPRRVDGRAEALHLAHAFAGSGQVGIVGGTERASKGTKLRLKRIEGIRAGHGRNG